MKCAIVHDFNAPPQYGDFTDPVAVDGETLVRVRAAALSPLARSQASGKHYSSGTKLPVVPGADGVGLLQDGRRVYFAFPRAPFGAMAEVTTVQATHCVAVPDEVDDVTAAAIGNPGMSSWAALTGRAHLRGGENVLINGATGVSGRLAIQIARHLGAGKIIVTGRNVKSIEGLDALGADVLLPLDMPADQLTGAFRDVIHEHRVDIVLDYLWGQPAECLLSTFGGHGGSEAEPRVRFIQIGSIAGSTINFAGAALRSSGLELMGSGLGSLSNAALLRSVGSLLKAVAGGGFSISAVAFPLRDVETVWRENPVSRVVFTA
jgi:NADPH:quinone reductase-like Zn-dependent oxidoreductase